MTRPDRQPARPPVVSEAEWAAANAAQVEREKAQMKAGDAVIAGRRYLPMVRMDPSYVFEGPSGPLTFAELFDGRPQLILYHFMLKPGSDHICPGCSMYTENLPHLAHVRERDITFVLGSRVPQDHIRRVQEKMGWQHIPWVSTEDRFAEEFKAFVGSAPSVCSGCVGESGAQEFGLAKLVADGLLAVFQNLGVVAGRQFLRHGSVNEETVTPNYV